MYQKQMFTRGMCIGKSKAYNETIQLLRTLWNINKSGKFTAYEIAKVSGYSSRHTHRLLLQMYTDGKVEFMTVIRKGKPARIWWAI